MVCCKKVSEREHETTQALKANSSDGFHRFLPLDSLGHTRVMTSNAIKTSSLIRRLASYVPRWPIWQTVFPEFLGNGLRILYRYMISLLLSKLLKKLLN
jgi:hypothetical protein